MSDRDDTRPYDVAEAMREMEGRAKEAVSVPGLLSWWRTSLAHFDAEGHPKPEPGPPDPIAVQMRALNRRTCTTAQGAEELPWWWHRWVPDWARDVWRENGLWPRRYPN